MSDLSICVIDDDLIYQTMAKRIIESAKIASRFLVFNDGEEAWNYMKNNHKNPDSLTDFIFLDLNMPFMDGWQFLQEYSKLKDQCSKKIKIFLVSSSVDPADTDKAKSDPNVAGYIFKPFTKEKFLAAIQA